MNDRTAISDPGNRVSFDEYRRSGLALFEQKRFGEAAEQLRQAYSLQPPNLIVGLKLGTALVHQGDAAGAIEVLSAISQSHPDLVEAAGTLANACMLIGDFAAAAVAFNRAITAAPNLAIAHFGLGSALASQGKIPDAITAFRAALRLNYPAAHCNLGVALLMTGAFDEASRELLQAIAFNPNDAVAHWNLALLRLLRGDWMQAWPEYEWRWRRNQFPSRRRDFKQPMWRGQDLAGQTLLLHAEQGFGDTIQLIRFLPLVKNRGAKIVMECQPELLPLFAQLPGDQQWVRAGDELPAFDFHCPLASLPLLFGTTLQTIPQQSPPLSAPADRVAHWRQRMGATDRRLRVGICWAGNSTFHGDQTRSVKLEQLRNILETPGIEFYSLQKGSPASRIRQMGLDERLTDLGSDFRDFADTAAAISLCDLIITTDTSVPHLAGAMGKAVWVMLQFVPDWRWLLDRPDSPWYPSARLFRQTSLGDWDGVVARVAAALTNM